MIINQSFINETSGVRLDAAIFSHFPSSSRVFIKEAFAEGTIHVDGKHVSKGARLKGGETIVIDRLLEADDNLVATEKNQIRGIRPVYGDEVLLAYDKPAGMPVQPLNHKELGTLMNGVVALHPECRAMGPALTAIGESPLMAGALHRIDADTSGLVLVARDIDTFKKMRDQFAAQSVKKTYLALVEGMVAVGGTIENYLIHDPTLPFCRMVDRDHNRLTQAQRAAARPMHAVTHYRPIASTTVENEERTLLEVTIYTGVTHQIRAQLALAGMHIINDRLYGAFAIEKQIGHCLHSYAASFQHPLTGETVEIRTELPAWAPTR